MTQADAEQAAAGEVGRPLAELLNSTEEPSQQSDAEVLMSLIRSQGPTTYGAAARALGWGAAQAWRAEAELRAAGRVTLNNRGQAVDANDCSA
ncbi:MAG: hypothetical protein AAGG47_13020 [Pseudomonadota bacterium]